MNVVLVGDTSGVTMAVRHIGAAKVVAIVGAEIRPQYSESLGKLAEALGAEFLLQPKPKDLRYAEFVRSLAACRPDVGVISSYSMKLQPDVLRTCRGGFVNVHPALLPQYRGANPTQWALLNGESTTGVTLHYVSEEIDTGDIIAQERVPIAFDDTWLTIRDRISAATEDLLSRYLMLALEGRAPRLPQDAAVAHYYGRRRPGDGLIEWQRTVRYIYNLIRGIVRPHPGAYFYSGEEKVTVDTFRTVAEVTALKFERSPAMRDTLRDDDIVLEPVKEEMSDTSSVAFNVHCAGQESPIGVAKIGGLSWQPPTASLFVNAKSSCSARVRGILDRFATTELEVVLAHVQ